MVSPAKADADVAEKAVLDEVERLRKILSSYDPAAELAKLNPPPLNQPVPASAELIDVLKQYDTWNKRTGGAYNGHLGELIALWKDAEKKNTLPTDAELAPVVQRLREPAWQIDESAKTVKRVSAQPINVDSLGKGYIIGKAVAAARAKAIKGLMLSIGGDVRVWGLLSANESKPWRVGVQDPAHPELNATPLTSIYVSGERAISSSGAYSRFYAIEGKKYSHILDPRTGRPAPATSATVVAKDSGTANALATSLCVLRPAEGFELVRHGGRGGLPHRSRGRDADALGRIQGVGGAKVAAAPAHPPAWPKGYVVKIPLTTVQSREKPYVFVWVTDASGKHVKTLGAWGE